MNLRPRWNALLLVLDLVSVLVFVAIGRRNHNESGTIDGVARTALPFVVGLLFGWAVGRAWTDPAGRRVGLVTWSVTLMTGLMVRRLIADRGTALAFVIVATIFLGVTLNGWRTILRLLQGTANSSVNRWPGDVVPEPTQALRDSSANVRSPALVGAKSSAASSSALSTQEDGKHA